MSRLRVLLWIFKRRCLGYREIIVSPLFLNKGFKLSVIAKTILLLICPLAAALFSARQLCCLLCCLRNPPPFLRLHQFWLTGGI